MPPMGYAGRFYLKRSLDQIVIPPFISSSAIQGDIVHVELENTAKDAGKGHHASKATSNRLPSKE